MGSNKSVNHVNEVMNRDIANSATIPAVEEAANLLEVKRYQIFIEDDSYIGNLDNLVGTVLEIRKKDGECPKEFFSENLYPEFNVLPIPEHKIDEKSRIKDPVKIKSFVVNQKLSAELGALNFLNANLDTESAYSITVFNQATVRVDAKDSSWFDGIMKWREINQDLIENEDICWLLVVGGAVQKTIIKKKYKKFNASLKGGAYGINIGGELYTSTEEYSLDTRYGLSVFVLKRPVVYKSDSPKLELGSQSNLKDILSFPNDTELKLFNKIYKIDGVIKP